MLGESPDDALALGEHGLAALARLPGLVGEVDQHAAAVRDVLMASGVALTRTAIRDYRDGFAQAALEKGWRPTAGRYDWEAVRIIAATWLMKRRWAAQSA